MSCSRKIKNICTNYNTYCNIEPETLCAQYTESVNSASWSNTHSDTNNIGNITTKPSYCKYCFNARIYKPTDEEMMTPFNTELTDGNDSSSCGVGHTVKDLRYMISSGHGEPVRIEIDRWNDNVKEWHTVGKYYPKYCPECGRKLNEYEH